MHPSFSDIILLDALGLKVERGSDMCDFSCLPRVAYLGDLCFQEPSIAKQIWIDQISQTIPQIDSVQIILFALNTPDNELPSIQQSGELKKRVIDFYYDNIIQFSQSQIFTMLDYLYFGDEITEKEDFKVNQNKQDDFNEIHGIPQPLRSAALQLFNKAMSLGMTKDVESCTFRALDRMITVAMIRQRGDNDIQKNQSAQNTGKFYVACEEIHDRLMKEKEDNDLRNAEQVSEEEK